jgi:hypothetical protein
LVGYLRVRSGVRAVLASRVARALRRPVLGLVVSALVFGVLEGAARIFVRSAGQASIPSDIVASHVAQGAMKFDPDLGWTWAKVPQPSLGINSDGLRYAELPKEKPAGVLRGFTLGDSQTFGAGLEPPDSYTAVAEARLQADGWPIQLVDAAVAGYGSLQALRLIEQKLIQWDPDFLVIDCRTFDSMRETRELRHRGALEPVRALLFESRVYYALRLALREAGNEQGRRMVPTNRSGDHRPGDGNHDLIAAFADKEGIQVVFVDYPLWFEDAVVSRAPAEELPPGYPVVPATAALLATGKPPAELFFDNNHLTVEGARVVGEALAETLSAVLERPAEP